MGANVAPQPTFTAKSDGKVRWTVELLQRADDAGLFGPSDRYELIGGDLHIMPVPDPLHQKAVRRIVKLLRAAIAHRPDVDIDISSPVSLGESDQPIPDVSLVRNDEDDYGGGHPTPEDTYLIVEVAHSHPEGDIKLKRLQYAAAGLQEYWVADLQKRELLVYRKPVDGDYQVE
ncbi:MAG: Uma2 family endonuclease, partial [Cyanobacteria bacterium J06636_16]